MTSLSSRYFSAANHRNDMKVATEGYRSYKQNESQEGLSSSDHLLKKEETYSTPNDVASRSRTSQHGYRNPMYKRENRYQTEREDTNVYDKASAETDTGNEDGTIQRRDIAKHQPSDVNTVNVRRSGRPIPMPGPSESSDAITRETLEERYEEKYHVEEQKSKSGSEL